MLLAALPAEPLEPSAHGSVVPAYDTWATDNWGEADGVPPDPRALLRTPDGYPWVGTPQGLVRFDGLHFRRPPVEDGGADLGVNALLSGEGGALWIAR